MRPNVLVTGTPGTGKTTLSELLCQQSGYRHINISEVVKEKKLFSSFDEVMQAYEIDDDKVCDEIEPMLEEGGCVVDTHSGGFLPERLVHLVVVLRADNTTLYDRLAQRGYSDRKLSENVTAEIMNVVLEDAHECFDPSLIIERPNATVDDLNKTLAEVVAWMASVQS